MIYVSYDTKCLHQYYYICKLITNIQEQLKFGT